MIASLSFRRSAGTRSSRADNWLPSGLPEGWTLCVSETSSTSSDPALFADQATGARVPSNAGAAQDRQIRRAVSAGRGAVRVAVRPVLIVVSLVLAQDLPPTGLIPDGGCDPGARTVTGLIQVAPPLAPVPPRRGLHRGRTAHQLPLLPESSAYPAVHENVGQRIELHSCLSSGQSPYQESSLKGSARWLSTRPPCRLCVVFRRRICCGRVAQNSWF
jgi:hypothetical protein